MTISRMRRLTPFGPTVPNICVCVRGVVDVINCAMEDPENGISHWNRSSPLQQCCSTAQTVMQGTEG